MTSTALGAQFPIAPSLEALDGNDHTVQDVGSQLLVRWAPPPMEGAPPRLQVLERAAFAVKLANGEFVCPQRLEASFEGGCDGEHSNGLLDFEQQQLRVEGGEHDRRHEEGRRRRQHCG